MSFLRRTLVYFWASPATLLGATLIPLAVVTGGSAAIVGGVVEVHGGLVSRLLRRGLPGIGSGAAMTLGHVVLGRDPSCLARSRAHERVHVRQYERWGPLLIPLYLSAALLAYLRGRDPYLDNPFDPSSGKPSSKPATLESGQSAASGSPRWTRQPAKLC